VTTPTPPTPTAERRKAFRVQGMFSVTVRWRRGRRSFDVTGTADNVSSGGFHARLPMRVDVGTRVFGVVVLPPGATVAARGHVIRLGPPDPGGRDTAVRFVHTRLLRASSS